MFEAKQRSRNKRKEPAEQVCALSKAIIGNMSGDRMSQSKSGHFAEEVRAFLKKETSAVAAGTEGAKRKREHSA